MSRKLLRLLVVGTAFLLLASPAGAQEYTLWQSALTAGSADPDVSFGSGGSPSIFRITSSSTGQKIVQIPCILPSSVQVNSIEICYQVSNASTYIDQSILYEMLGPGPATARLDETTDLNSTTPTCFTSTAVPFPDPYSPSGSMTLVLYLQFANTSHWIDIGGIAVHVEPAP